MAQMKVLEYRSLANIMLNVAQFLLKFKESV